MATSAPNQPPPGSSSVSAPQPPPLPPNSDPITWDGDKMFNIYILDYCKKRGYLKTANQLVTEADISPESKPPINAQQGLLFEWWSVFWVLFQAKNSGAGSEDAMLYHKHQAQMKLRNAQGPPPGVPQAPGRYTIPNGVAGPVPQMSNSHINGIGPAGQPPSLAASPYGHTNPPSQPNGIPGPPAPPGPPGQPFPTGMVGRPPLGPQQRLPNGGPPYQSPPIAPSPQSQGNPQQPPTGPIGQLGRSPHMSTINRAAMLPPNGPQHAQGPGHAGSAHQTPTLAYQQLHRPSSGLDAASQHPMNPHPSPALGVRMTPGQERSHIENRHSALDAELASYPPDLLGEAKLIANVHDREAQSLTLEEKQSIVTHATQLKQKAQQNSGITGPSGANVHGPLQNRGSMPQPMQQQLSMQQQQRVTKRSSTSPGEEHQTLPRNEQSPPDRKRQRKTTPNGEQQQQQPQSQPQPPQQQQQQSQPQPPPPPQQPQQAPQPPQQQPPMVGIGSLPSGLQPGAGAGRGMPMTGGQVPPNGFGPPSMHQMGMAPGPMTPMHAISPGMGHPPLGVMNPQQMGLAQMPPYGQTQYRPGLMHNKGGPPVVPGDPQAQAHMRGPGAMGNRIPGQHGPPQPGQPPKPIGGSMLPPQSGMNGPPKPGGKDGEGELNPAAPSSTPTPHLNAAPPMNPQRPPTASALPTPAPPPPAAPPGPMSDLPFDMNDMFGNTGGDFDFGVGGDLGDMNLWFDPSAVHEG